MYYSDLTKRGYLAVAAAGRSPKVAEVLEHVTEEVPSPEVV